MLRNYKQRIKEWLPFNIWNYIPESIRRLYAGNPLLISREIRELKKKLLSDYSTWEDLKRYSSIASYDNNHQFYQSMLQSFDSSIEFDNIDGVAFVGNGFGLGSLNSYRKVYYQDKSKSVTCFEKVYVRQSPDFNKMCWFYSSVYKQLKNDLHIPALMHVTGKKLGVSYFQWVEKSSMSDSELIQAFMSVILHLENVRLDNDTKQNPLYSNYMNDSIFSVYFGRAHKWLTENKGQLEAGLLHKINDYAIKDSSVNKRFVHGNISRSNLISPNVLIDFDSCGYYPIEYEIGSFLTNAFTFKSTKQFNVELRRICDEYPADVDERLTLYFSFIFNMRIKHSEGYGFEEKRGHFLNELWNKLIQISK